MQLSKRMDWESFEKEFSDHFGERGPKALSVRLVVGLMYLKHAENLSDEALIERWVENGYWQYFCGFEYFQHKPPCDPTSLVKWRNRIGDEGMKKMLQETLRIALKEEALKPEHVLTVIVDTTVQEKNITFPTDAKLLDRSRRKLVKQADRDGIVLRQSYVRVGKRLLHKHARYRHAKQYNRARKPLKSLRTILGRVLRDIQRKVEIAQTSMSEKMTSLWALASKVHAQVADKKTPNKIYSLHEPHVACIAKGKSHKPYEFGSKVSIVTSAHVPWVLGVQNFGGNPYDGSTLKQAITDVESNTSQSVKSVFVDKGYRGTVHWPEHVSVFVSGRKNLSKKNHRLLKRRQAIEPVIGHLKFEHRLGRNFLSGIAGDIHNALLAGIAFNFRKLVRWFRSLFVFYCLVLFRPRPMTKAHLETCR